MDKPHTASGNRFIAGLLGLPCLALPLVLITAHIPYHPGGNFLILDLLLLSSLVGGFALGWHLGAIRGDRRWKLLGMFSSIVAGAAFGLSMEGTEGALWGGLAGVIPGFLYGLYAPWIAWRIPSRCGAIAAWNLIGILLFVAPLLILLRTYDRKFDGDQIPCVIVAAMFAIRHASNRGWWKSGEISLTDIRRIVGFQTLIIVVVQTAAMLGIYLCIDMFLTP